MSYRQTPLLFVVFGITGDLARRKILPALYELLKKGELPNRFTLVGVTRQAYSVDTLFERSFPDNTDDVQTLAKLKAATVIATLDMEDPDSYAQLHSRLTDESSRLGDGTVRLYYLSIPSQAFAEVIGHLGMGGHNRPLANETVLPRLLIEKPFGYDLDSAQQLVTAAEQYFSETQLYRIDHYLAKETAQNILTFRFDNPLFQTIWNARHIDHITITAHEAIGIEGRANFYEQTGALRDIIQSHLLQLLALVTMEQPGTFDSTGIRRAKRRLLEAITPVATEKVADKTARGQYNGYRDEVDNHSSMVETFARIELEIDTEQWRSVPIVLETGKGLSQRQSRIAVHFRPGQSGRGSNILTFRLQPQEGITLSLETKAPGLANEIRTVEMAFDYATSFGASTADAYQRVIIDAIRGDQSLFLSSEEVMACWQVVQNVLSEWKKDVAPLHFYDIGSQSETIGSR